jgi:Uma2 family endonuclease
MAIANSRPHVEAAPHAFTAADLPEMPGELPSGPVRYELDNGRLVAMSPPGHIHGKIVMRIGSELRQAGEKQGHGEVSGAESGVLLWRNPDRVVGVDAVFICAASLPSKLTAEGYLETIPDLVVEVVSKNDTRPYVQRKVDDYLQAGVRVVWVADPDARTLTEHRRDQDPRVFTESEPVVLPDLIPGLQISLKEMFDI